MLAVQPVRVKLTMSPLERPDVRREVLDLGGRKVRRVAMLVLGILSRQHCFERRC